MPEPPVTESRWYAVGLVVFVVSALWGFAARDAEGLIVAALGVVSSLLCVVIGELRLLRSEFRRQRDQEKSRPR